MSTDLENSLKESLQQLKDIKSGKRSVLELKSYCHLEPGQIGPKAKK